jgi:hypothetical protein
MSESSHVVISSSFTSLHFTSADKSRLLSTRLLTIALIARTFRLWARQAQRKSCAKAGVEGRAAGLHEAACRALPVHHEMK